MNLDINNYDEVIKFAKEQVKNFNLNHKNFAGGRFQTDHPNIFVHVRTDKTLAKIEINKTGGSIFFLKP